MRTLSAVCFITGLFCGVTDSPAQQDETAALRAQRLAAVGRLYGVVKYFHPTFLSRDVPWDSAVVAAIPRIREARSRADYSAAIINLLRVLDDPTSSVGVESTRLVTELKPVGGSALTTRWEPDGTLIVKIPCCFQENYRALADVASLITRTPRVVFDLRGPTPGIRGEADDEFSAELDGLLAYGSIAGPVVRRRMHNSYDGTTANAVASMYDVGGQIYRGRPDNTFRRVAFVAYADSDLPSIAWALQEAGQGTVVLDDARGHSRLPDPSLPESPLFRVDLGEGLIATVRVVDVVGRPNGMLSPDTVVSMSGPTDRPLQTALDIIRSSRRIARPATTASHPIRDAEERFDAPRFPALPHRILAGYRYWNAIRYFYPSSLPPAVEWDEVLATSLRDLEQARDTVEYWLAINAMARRLADGHAQVPGLAPYVTGRAGPRVLLRFVEDRVVVTRVMRDSATATSGIRVGDVIVRVDGEDVHARMTRILNVLPGTSRAGEPNGPPLNQLLFGDPGTNARLTIEREDGVLHEVGLPRVLSPCLPASCAPREGESIRFVTPDIGYVDLYAVTESMVDTVFDAFKETRAIIFDGRGRNAGAPPAIAARLAETIRFVAGRGRRPLVLSPDLDVRRTREGSLYLEGKPQERYRGKTVLLIDDRAFSNAEQVAFFFAGANGTTLIGSPTAGGVGGITTVTLPGGIGATFPGSEALLADGRPIIRVGVPPDLLVRPTIAGIRAGRDEVLERAVAYLAAGR
jgi:C-terminal processing protease CtpA/Prc